ncbi:hypothetical protein AN640_02455 [Candidatus Epulonipiscium fishelsonii]|uniref:Uncharacterized protein n=1 Tax=Candidatus Epulonipiscium fishelsonii TaxID=77094 RepID=A0ACC8X972_9FIRM|nr:hypothetical protein AN640_02455 [Epulopiscium sp. SCG-D08WGA-EpuloA1]OON92916.1 MAG: hypothetical protein ATN32_09250 [Epulopiscium sp. AS2M-Bin002]
MFCAIKISKSDPTPLYIQLANELIRLIETGTLPAKTKLPTIRNLSNKLRINRDTVVNAYRVLESKNLVIAHIGSGTYVSPIAPAKTPSSLNPISCSKAYFDKSIFSIDISKELLNKMLDDDGWDAFIDPLQRERQLMRQSISEYLNSVGISPPPAYTRLINNSSKFILELMKLSAKSVICVEAYRDLIYTTVLKNLGFKIIEIPINKDGLDLEFLETQLKSHNVAYIMITPYIQNPTGICYSEENKLKILNLCEQYDSLLIEDGTFTDFVFQDVPIKPCYTLDKNDRVIYLYNFCKLYMPHLDYSFAVLPQSINKMLLYNNEFTLKERLLRYYLESNYFANIHYNLIQSTYSKYITVYEALLKRNDIFEINNNVGGLFFWIKVNDINITELYKMFLFNNIVVSPEDLFCTTYTNKYFRLSISSLSDLEIEQLVLFLTKEKTLC